jgi:hypothetical protein
MEAPMPATIRPGEGHLGCSRPYAAYVQPEQMSFEKLSAPRAAASALYFPDISNFQAGLTIQPKTVAVIAKASEGATFTDGTYKGFKAQAARVGALFSAYHFLWSSSAAEVRHVYGIVGKTPLMLDAENTHVKTTVAMIVAFAKAYRAAGGVVWGVYLPRWYWQGTLGSPSLAPLKAAGLALVSSNYTTYSDGGPGWGAYGGVTPRQWQYTNALAYGGQRVDFNAFKGTVADLRALWTGSSSHHDDEGNPDVPTFSSYGLGDAQPLSWEGLTTLTWSKEYADPTDAHADPGQYPGYIAPRNGYVDIDVQVGIDGLQAPSADASSLIADYVQLYAVAYDWQRGKAVNGKEELLVDGHATTGVTYLGKRRLKYLKKGQHLYIAVLPYSSAGAGRPQPQAVLGTWRVAQY